MEKPSPREPKSLDFPRSFGKYVLVAPLHNGKLAEIFRAKSLGVEGFEKKIVIKRILQRFTNDNQFVGLFIQEAKKAAELAHVNLTQVFDLGEVNGKYFLAIELVEGKDLKEILEISQRLLYPLPVPVSISIAIQLCDALEYGRQFASSSGEKASTIHGEIVPSNILISSEGGVKFLGVGFSQTTNWAAKLNPEITRSKFGYMSPEQITCGSLDHRSDLFSLGVVLYEMLTGQRLFKGPSDSATLESNRRAEFLPPRSLNREIPPMTETVLLKVLTRDPEDRFATAAQFRAELQKVQNTLAPASRSAIGEFLKQLDAQSLE